MTPLCRTGLRVLIQRNLILSNQRFYYPAISAIEFSLPASRKLIINVNSINQIFHLPPDTFKQMISIDKPKNNQEIITYCKRGIRGENAAQLLLNLGFKNVKNYKGSYIDWCKKENLPAP